MSRKKALQAVDGIAGRRGTAKGHDADTTQDRKRDVSLENVTKQNEAKRKAERNEIRNERTERTNKMGTYTVEKAPVFLTTEGTHNMEFVTFEEFTGKWGQAAKLGFRVIDKDDNEIRLTALAPLKIHAKTKLGMWLSNMQEKPIKAGDKVDFPSFFGQYFKVIVRNIKKDEGEFSNVTEILGPTDDENVPF